jgi:hypothetical protein
MLLPRHQKEMSGQINGPTAAGSVDTRTDLEAVEEKTISYPSRAIWLKRISEI